MAKTAADLDERLKVERITFNSDVKFYNVLSEPFSLYGLFYEDGYFRRMPLSVAKRVSEGVEGLHANCAGGRVRFRTDSKTVAIKATLDAVGRMPHFALTGTASFDVYVNEGEGGTDKFFGTFVPPYDVVDGYESSLDFRDTKMRDITVHFPLYSNVKELKIGVEDCATLTKPAPYRYAEPVVFYGHSITQGGCACRPGNAYPNILSRLLRVDHVNLGFSGNAKGEEAMAEYIAALKMLVFVYDYDHNAPSVEHLRATHERMFRTIREKNPLLPIVIMTATSDERVLRYELGERKAIIYQTYENAVKRGDKNVYFVDGEKVFDECRDYGTVEGCHPNDYGFFVIAKALRAVLDEILIKLQ